MQISERLAKETAREYAFRVLQDNIIMLELEPGSVVSEKELADELNLSRTPVREALIELSRSKIVEIFPQRGSIISKIDYELVEEARFIRLTLEKAIIELACSQEIRPELSKLKENLKLQQFYIDNPAPDKLLLLDNEFHKELFIMCKKRQTYMLMNSMTAHFDRVRSISLKTIKDIKIVEDHNAILEAIENRDVATGIARMEKHLSRYKIDKEDIKEKYPQYFKD